MSRLTLPAGLMPFWMLNDASTTAQKIDYLRACHAGGIKGLALHCRAGNLIPYASTEWFEQIRSVVEEGRRLGMRLWLYDEDPYPSGAAGGMVMAERRELTAEAVECRRKPAALRPGQLWFVSEKRVLWAGLVAVGRPRPARELTGLVGTVRADWFMGTWDSRYYYDDAPVFPCPRGNAVRQVYTMRVPEIPAGYELVALCVTQPGEHDVWGGLPDLLNPATFPTFCRLSLDRYDSYVGRHFARTIPGIFTDEAKPHGGTPITGDLFQSFRARYGYDLRARLYQLFGEPLSEEYLKARADYRRWVGDRFMDGFVRPYRQWCDRRSLLLAGHFSPEDDPFCEAMHLVSVMPIMKAMSLPGTDVIVPHIGNESPQMNLGSVRVGSLKSQFGHPYAASESLALCDWDVTSDKCRQILTWQKALGVDRFFVHGFYTTNEGVQAYEAPPDYGPRSSIFAGITVVNEWLAELDAVMDGSRDTAEVAILNSLTNYTAYAPGSENRRLRDMRNALWQTLAACLRSHVAVHMVDEPDLAAAKVTRGGLRVGRALYRHLIVPACDYMPESVARAASAAARAGVAVWWLAGGPKRVIDARDRFRAAPALSGRKLRAAAPEDGWCRRNLPAQAVVRGDGAGDCYVRRFTASAGGEYLLAVNVGERDLSLELGCEGARAWVPVRADGAAVPEGGGVRWSLPGRGSGLFRLGRGGATGPAHAGRKETGRARTFERMGRNLVRLCETVVVRPGRKPFRIAHPKPYWQLFKDYSATRVFTNFLGDLPIESTVAESRLTYRFGFRVAGDVGRVSLVLDPRCARGRFRVFLNGRAVGGERVRPLEHITSERVPLPGLKRGRNELELRFAAQGAMDGLMSQVYLEGDFDAGAGRKGEAVLRPASGADGRGGWTGAGLPHYMGAGRYRWSEELTAAEAARFRSIEFDRIVDSAALTVNGRRLGARAWRTWRWDLPGLRAGRNTFELTVTGTAGNKHKLAWPNQPQGWIGRAFLLG